MVEKTEAAVDIIFDLHDNKIVKDVTSLIPLDRDIIYCDLVEQINCGLWTDLQIMYLFSVVLLYLHAYQHDISIELLGIEVI